MKKYERSGRVGDSGIHHQDSMALWNLEAASLPSTHPTRNPQTPIQPITPTFPQTPFLSQLFPFCPCLLPHIPHRTPPPIGVNWRRLYNWSRKWKSGFSVDLVTITSLLIAIHKHGCWDWTDRLIKHVREGDLVPAVLRWKAGMEASINNLHTNKNKNDYSPMFPSKRGFSDIMSFMTGALDTEIKHEDQTSSEQVDEWSPSPHMDKLANQVKSTGNASRLFTPARGQRVQQKMPDSFDIDMVNTFLSIFLAKGKMSLACKLFEIFTDAGVDPVSYTYNSTMSSFVKKGYFNEAWTEMGEKLCPTDIATFNMIIQGLGKMGRADLASAVLDRLLKQGGYLDIVMYNTLGKAGRIDEVNKFFEQMKSSGINPDVVTYNTLIEVHSKAGRVKDAYKFLKMMLDAGCTPNHVTDMTLDYLSKEIDKLRYQKATISSEKNDPS